MQIHSQIGKTPLTILIDSGSTHNFLHHKFAKIIGLKSKMSCLFSVVVSNGERLSSPGHFNGVKLSLHGIPIKVDFFVLGVQWLGILGPILWDFGRMQMQFTIARRKVLLQGSTSLELQALEGDTVSRILRQSDGKGIILQLCAIQYEHTNHELLSDAMAPLLIEFSELFEAPMGLPPPGSHDHRIPLQPGAGPICVCPYRSSHFHTRD